MPAHRQDELPRGLVGRLADSQALANCQTGRRDRGRAHRGTAPTCRLRSRSRRRRRRNQRSSESRSGRHRVRVLTAKDLCPREPGSVLSTGLGRPCVRVRAFRVAVQSPSLHRLPQAQEPGRDLVRQCRLFVLVGVCQLQKLAHAGLVNRPDHRRTAWGLSTPMRTPSLKSALVRRHSFSKPFGPAGRVAGGVGIRRRCSFGGLRTLPAADATPLPSLGFRAFEQPGALGALDPCSGFGGVHCAPPRLCCARTATVKLLSSSSVGDILALLCPVSPAVRVGASRSAAPPSLGVCRSIGHRNEVVAG